MFGFANPERVAECWMELQFFPGMPLRAEKGQMIPAAFHIQTFQEIKSLDDPASQAMIGYARMLAFDGTPSKMMQFMKVYPDGTVNG